jgi:outer membrane protein
MKDLCHDEFHLRALVMGVLLSAVLGLVATSGTTATLRLDAAAAAERAIEVSHPAAAAEKQVDAARSGVTAADAARLPSLSASASAEERSSVPELTVPFGAAGLTTIFPDIRTAYGFAVDLTQPVYTGGGITAGRNVSRHELAATQSDQRSAEAGVTLRAKLAYWHAAADRAAVDAARAQMKRAGRLLRDARSLRKAGMAVDADVLAAQARAAAARLALINAQTAAESSRAALRSLLAVPAGTELELADSLPQKLPTAPRPLPALQRDAQSHRPDIAALAARVDATAERERVVRAADRPKVGATVAWNVARPNPRYLPLADKWNDSWSVGVAARWALWDGGRTRAAAAEVQAKKGALSEQLAEARRQVNLDVEQARLGLLSALAAVTAADASQQASSARMAAENQRYEAGLSTTSDVLNAQADLASAEIQRVRARTGAWMARAKLEWAVGR